MITKQIETLHRSPSHLFNLQWLMKKSTEGKCWKGKISKMLIIHLTFRSLFIYLRLDVRMWFILVLFSLCSYQRFNFLTQFYVSSDEVRNVSAFVDECISLIPFGQTTFLLVSVRRIWLCEMKIPSNGNLLLKNTISKIYEDSSEASYKQEKSFQRKHLGIMAKATGCPFVTR